MALTDESGVNVSMPVAPMGYPYGGNFGGGFGFGNGDWSWIIILLLFGMFGGWGGNGNFGGNNSLYPWLLNDNTQSGFENAALGSQLSGIQNSINNGFATAEISACGRAADALNRSFDAQTAVTSGLYNINTALQNCCCENRANIADLKYTIATENCADRQAISDALRDVIEANTASTQRVLDQLCQDKIDSKNDTIAQLRQELMFARGQASQDVQTAAILAGQNNEIDALYNRLNNCPVGTVPVYGRTPIFSCNNGGCGCVA